MFQQDGDSFVETFTEFLNYQYTIPQIIIQNLVLSPYSQVKRYFTIKRYALQQDRDSLVKTVKGVFEPPICHATNYSKLTYAQYTNYITYNATDIINHRPESMK